MEKIKLNNQIVLMRKHVKQAKVHSINRLTKQMKLLQNRKGEEVQVMKAKRKAERYLQEISLLKKLKPDCVSKLALSKAKNWKEILSQKNSTLEDRCIAILASYGPVQKEVERFHNANKDIVSKISDFLKQWEDKSKFSKDSSQKKKSNFQNSSNVLKTKVKEGLLNDMTNQSSDNGNSKSLNGKTDNSLLIENNPSLKSNEKKEEIFLKQKLGTSIKPSQDSFLLGNKSNNEYLAENRMETKISDEIEKDSGNLLGNDFRNELEWTDSIADNETKIGCESSNKNKTENEYDQKNEKSDNECDIEKDESDNEYAMENDESDNECNMENDESDNEPDMENNKSDNESYLENENSNLEIFPENKPKTECTKVKNTNDKKINMSVHSKYDYDFVAIKKNPNIENKTTSCSIKTDNRGSKSSENKLKAIAMINLDDFRDLDEIPVDNSIENNESSDEEEVSNDDSSNKVPQNDPFFLGHDEAVCTENKLIDDLKSNNFVSVNDIFERKEKPNNHYNYTKDFHKTSNSSRFPSKYSESKGDKNFKTWKKDKVIHNHHQDRFQYERKGSFEYKNTDYKHQAFKHRNNDRYIKKEFNQKASLETHRYPKQRYSGDVDKRNGDNFSGNSKDIHKKSDANSKPLHPSWEAKRKQKEMTNMSFQGKKIVFED